jgi:cobalt-precorrin-5B (C1)-methyltransferase
MDREFLSRLATDAGCSSATVSAIAEITLARELWTTLPEVDRGRMMHSLLAACHTHCAPLLPGGVLSIILIEENGGTLYRFPTE